MKFLELLRTWFACPELAKDFDASAHPQSQKPKWPESKGRAPLIGTGRKMAIHSANDFCAASFRIADYGLLVEFSLRIWDIEFRVTTDGLAPGSWPGAWFLPRRAKS